MLLHLLLLQVGGHSINNCRLRHVSPQPCRPFGTTSQSHSIPMHCLLYLKQNSNKKSRWEKYFTKNLIAIIFEPITGQGKLSSSVKIMKNVSEIIYSSQYWPRDNNPKTARTFFWWLDRIFGFILLMHKTRKWKNDHVTLCFNWRNKLQIMHGFHWTWLLKFGHYEKATKIWNNLPLHLTFAK